LTDDDTGNIGIQADICLIRHNPEFDVCLLVSCAFGGREKKDEKENKKNDTFLDKWLFFLLIHLILIIKEG
jgi:hypothetical protein